VDSTTQSLLKFSRSFDKWTGTTQSLLKFSRSFEQTMPGLPPVLTQDNVIDYSFMEVKDLSELVHVAEDSDEDNQQVVIAEVKKIHNMKALRISSNEITDISTLFKNLSHVMTSPELIRWIDLSYNKIVSFGDSLKPFHSLTVLYMHANSISKFSDIKPLRELPFLTKLSLHGNTIESKKHYRSYIIHTFPRLHMLDFSCITKQDRTDSQTWALIFRRKLNKKKEGEDI